MDKPEKCPDQPTRMVGSFRLVSCHAKFMDWQGASSLNRRVQAASSACAPSPACARKVKVGAMNHHFQYPNRMGRMRSLYRSEHLTSLVAT
ncbi:hypothetical protein CC1G_14322 [Coprinopsis cinerea okayama7|uniref:Uncharacterized protein n=1 Tax=Coprinopsis cinerea (strain Okayama-7 / 130 / ATCC MYA-4618 / FGSC 9003) TaxID=240176 RepID=D6RLZ4_COPC7|nr:hypothetical protein CC1G_14322 [Coprinopsis cinerea okayama7\|eukprot:XP_002911327.1 hypothetical protein CC1G_14322 [Coprinopsis cinerea okayama7\